MSGETVIEGGDGPQESEARGDVEGMLAGATDAQTRQDRVAASPPWVRGAPGAVPVTGAACRPARRTMPCAARRRRRGSGRFAPWAGSFWPIALYMIGLCLVTLSVYVATETYQSDDGPEVEQPREPTASGVAPATE